MEGSFRQALRQNRVLLGGWLQIGHPALAEIHGRLGFDWVCVDLEHGATDLETTANIFRTLAAFDCAPVARLPQYDETWVRRVLDAGAHGLIVPMVCSRRQAEQVVQLAKYPPLGTRGFGFARANMHGIDFNRCRQTANDDIATIVMIEHKDAIACLDDILSVEGVDGAFIGPLDLSGSMGIVGQLDHPDMIAALDAFLAACKRHRVAAGMHVVQPTPERIQERLAGGYTLLALGLDVLYLAEGARTALRAAGREIV
jgi:2-keto-3-deoxy-L-rhamnonate aldolase RhmA